MRFLFGLMVGTILGSYFMIHHPETARLFAQAEKMMWTQYQTPAPGEGVYQTRGYTHQDSPHFGRQPDESLGDYGSRMKCCDQRR